MLRVGAWASVGYLAGGQITVISAANGSSISDSAPSALATWKSAAARAAYPSSAVLPIPGSPRTTSTRLYPGPHLREQPIQGTALLPAAPKHHPVPRLGTRNPGCPLGITRTRTRSTRADSADRAARPPGTRNTRITTIATKRRQPVRRTIPARLDRLRWSRFHTRLVLGLGTAWILDGLESIIASSVTSKLAQAHTLNLSTAQAASIASAGASAGYLTVSEIFPRDPGRGHRGDQGRCGMTGSGRGTAPEGPAAADLPRQRQAAKVLITGASSGIGRELARLYASDGAELVLIARSEDKLCQLAEELAARHGAEAQVVPADLSRPGSPREIVEALVQRHIDVDVLVNNAGFAALGPVAGIGVEHQVEMIEVNVAALTQLTALLLPGMLERRRGAILKFASTAAFQPGPNRAVHCATKAYVLSFTEALAEEVRGSGVRVSCLAPGATDRGSRPSSLLTRQSNQRQVVPEVDRCVARAERS